jgi:hypothetical protein
MLFIIIKMTKEISTGLFFISKWVPKYQNLYYYDIFSPNKGAPKQAKYDSLLNNICARGWNVAPIIIITAGA